MPPPPPPLDKLDSNLNSVSARRRRRRRRHRLWRRRAGPPWRLPLPPTPAGADLQGLSERRFLVAVVTGALENLII